MANSKYADTAPVEQPYLVEHNVFINDHRGFTPSGGSDSKGIYGQLAANSVGNGDWSWQPQRYRSDAGYIFDQIDLVLLESAMRIETKERTADLERQMPTYQVRYA